MIVHAEGLSLSYGRTRALADVSFTLSRGVTGLLGPNGAGKTTLLRILATAMPAHGGRLTMLGEDPHTGAGRLAIRRRLGYLPQAPGFHPNFTAFEFVDYVAILKELGERRSRHREVGRVIAEVGLTEQRGKRIRALSGGMRQRVALAAALVGDPELLILDEPTVGLDPEQRMRFRELIAHLGEDRTVLLSTHQTEDVSTVCQRVLVLDHGLLRFEGTPDDLAATAAGRVWSSDTKVDGALASWRTSGGAYRNLGRPPAGAMLLTPSLEDGYLTLLERAEVTV